MTKLNHPWAKLAVLALIALLAGGCASTRTSQSTGGYIDDSAITAKVKAALLNAEDVPSTQISVETFKGVVQLSGFVDNRQAEQRAVDIARDVDGVKDVEDRMTVRGLQGGGL